MICSQNEDLGAVVDPTTATSSDDQHIGNGDPEEVYSKAFIEEKPDPKQSDALAQSMKGKTEEWFWDVHPHSGRRRKLDQHGSAFGRKPLTTKDGLVRPIWWLSSHKGTDPNDRNRAQRLWE